MIVSCSSFRDESENPKCNCFSWIICVISAVDCTKKIFGSWCTPHGQYKFFSYSVYTRCPYHGLQYGTQTYQGGVCSIYWYSECFLKYFQCFWILEFIFVHASQPSISCSIARLASPPIIVCIIFSHFCFAGTTQWVGWCKMILAWLVNNIQCQYNVFVCPNICVTEYLHKFNVRFLFNNNLMSINLQYSWKWVEWCLVWMNRHVLILYLIWALCWTRLM